MNDLVFLNFDIDYIYVMQKKYVQKAEVQVYIIDLDFVVYGKKY